MFKVLKNIFGKRRRQIQEALGNGATIIDVRTIGEYSSGHIQGSKNIPLEKIAANYQKISKMKMPLVLCCASGIRSANATMILKSKGIPQVFNGGSWMRINNLLNR